MSVSGVAQMSRRRLMATSTTPTITRARTSAPVPALRWSNDGSRSGFIRLASKRLRITCITTHDAALGTAPASTTRPTTKLASGGTASGVIA